MVAREGGRFQRAADPKPRWSPQGADPHYGVIGGRGAAERARADGSAIRAARVRSRGSSRSEHDAATKRIRSGYVAGLPQTPQNVTRPC